MFGSSRVDRSIWPQIIVPLLAGLLMAAVLHGSAQAAPQSHVYVIPESDGYGVVECLTTKSDCGKTVADSWCESHGHGSARAFGRAEDITASISAEPALHKAEAGAAVISCND